MNAINIALPIVITCIKNICYCKSGLYEYVYTSADIEIHWSWVTTLFDWTVKQVESWFAVDKKSI